MLEDESGRIVLVGDVIKSAQLVTGVILAALGMETPSGEFEVVDICFAGLAPQTRNQPLTQPTQSDAMEVDSESDYTFHEGRADSLTQANKRSIDATMILGLPSCLVWTWALRVARTRRLSC